jgi:SAM-dependent methyltransferase
MASRYQGLLGEQYFRYQLEASRDIVDLEAKKFTGAIRPTDTVLDFGCGSGQILSLLECSRRIGIEINPIARGCVESLGIECLPSLDGIPDGCIDVVISNHALEHVERPLDELRQIRRVLRTGGRLVMSVPIDDWRLTRRYDPYDSNRHLYTWSVQLLGNCLESAGFHVDARSIRVLKEAFPGRYSADLRRVLGEFGFGTFCTVFSVLSKRRQLVADVLSGR